MFQPQHWSRDLTRFRSSDADYANPSASRGRGDGYDGVVEVHGAILAGKLGNSQRPHSGNIRKPLWAAGI